MFKDLCKKLYCESGQGLAEYSLMLGIIAVTALVALNSLSSGIEGIGSSVSQILIDKTNEINN